MNEPAIEIIDKRIKELVDEANRMLIPYNSAIAELQKLREALVPAPVVDNDPVKVEEQS